MFSWPSTMPSSSFGPALVGVQVGPADVGGGDPNDRVERLLDPGIVDLVDRDVRDRKQITSSMRLLAQGSLA